MKKVGRITLLPGIGILLLLFAISIWGISLSNTNVSAILLAHHDCPLTPNAGTDPSIEALATPGVTPAPLSKRTSSTTSPAFCQSGTNYPLADGQVLWAADWEPGSSQWSIHTGMPDWGNSSVEKVQSPVRQGQYAAKFTVNQGAPDGGDSERAEVSSSQQETGGYAGQDWYYSWSTYVPSDPNKATGWSDWTDITQWMDMRHNCSPPLQVDVVPKDGTSPQFILDHELNSQTSPCDYSKPADQYPLADLSYDRWTDFTAHVKWSEDPQVGYVQMWVNGQSVLPLTHMQTLDPDSKGVYMEQALYRPDRSGTNVLYMDATHRHTTYTGTPDQQEPISCATPSPTTHVPNTSQGTSLSSSPCTSPQSSTPTPEPGDSAAPEPISSPTPGPTASATSTSDGGGTDATGTTPAKGIFQFSSHNAATNADNPALQGTNLNYYWSKLEPEQGQYNWDVIDKDMQPWVDHHKRVILRVATSGWQQWDPDLNSGHATPQWVYDSGVQSVTEVDQSVHPQYWNPKFLAAYQSFIQAMAQHYDTNPNVAAIQMGIGDGGETKVDTRRNNNNMVDQWKAIGYSDPVWWDTIQKIVDMYTSSFHHVPLAILPDSSFIGKTTGYGESMVAKYAVNHNLWLQDDGLVTNRSLDPSWMNVPHIEEQRRETKQSGDTLQDDLTAAINVKATYVLVFASDIDQPGNADTLQNAARQLAQK